MAIQFTDLELAFIQNFIQTLTPQMVAQFIQLDTPTRVTNISMIIQNDINNLQTSINNLQNDLNIKQAFLQSQIDCLNGLLVKIQTIGT